MTTSGYITKILNYHDSLEEWDIFVNNSPQGCIFCKSWWLNAVLPKSFKILTVRKGEKIIAGMPLPILHKWGSMSISMPQFTQTLGALLLPSLKNTYERKLSEEMEVLKILVEEIPKYSHFTMNFHYNFTNWIPFYWAGFSQMTQYTYIIKNLTDLDKVFFNFTYSKKKNIKKAEKQVTIFNDMSSKDFYMNHVMTLRKYGKSIDYKYDIFQRIYDAAIEHSAGRIWCAVDKKGNIHAAIFVIFNEKSAYYLISTIDPEYRNSGAATLLQKEAIFYLSKYTKQFDFEGSMTQGIEHSFRKFGAIQTPYFRITKDNRSLFVKISQGLANRVINIPRIFKLR